MPTINDFNASNTAYQESEKCARLIAHIRANYKGNAAANSAVTTLDTLYQNWRGVYATELAAATIDALPSDITDQITALQSTYNNR